ncbi:MAG: cytochrome c oxidase subunit II [Thaumarchaeota archaeon]|nr:cytochrome c oxidase subunit II [Nitrososphaerota archaeon]
MSNTYETFTGLFGTFSTLAIIVGAVVLGLMTYLILRYRDKGTSTQEPEDAPTLGKLPAERGKVKTIAVSLTLSTTILVFLVFGTFGALDNILTPPKDAIDIKVTAFQWGWKFAYPNGYEETKELRVPVGKAVRLIVVSEDVFHNFGIYDYKIKIDAIKGRTNHIWFEAKQPGEFTIQCYELCGIGHAFMKAKLVAMEPGAFNAWYSTSGA